LALSWSDTKIVNYFSNCYGPQGQNYQWKRNQGDTIKHVRIIPGIIFLFQINLFFKKLQKLIYQIIMLLIHLIKV